MQVQPAYMRDAICNRIILKQTRVPRINSVAQIRAH